jgi:hypothetical protein
VGAQNAHNWTASIMIGIEPKPAQLDDMHRRVGVSV